METKLLMSTSFHPDTDGHTERTIQTLEDMLRACVMEYQGSWEDHLDLIEFSNNNSYYASIGMPPFEALYGRKCRSPVCWSDISETMVLGLDMIEDMVKQVKLIQEKMKAAQDRLNLPGELEKVHNVFHVSQLRKYVPDTTHVLQPENIEMEENLTYEERPVKILDTKVRSTRNKDVRIVKLLWTNHRIEEATWEAEADMRKRYPELFLEVSGRVTKV
ncbi:uncharacterized protein LOC110719942 [Chenopodium quinoa]|uniref:uncharacterized protein LOC110719942 n=1 Tax=Chenopodium quinoa TaxID=63459 RepID=UPI000B780D5B|nr:uncharacterized protein LOC110719942 [Chenopodium quinoa]